MTDLSIKKKTRITITASSEGVKIAENALIRLGFDTKSNFAKPPRLARSTVSKFFNCQPIQLDSFKKICQELKLDWMKIAVLPEEAQSQKLEIINDCNSLDINNEVGREMLTQILNRQVTVIDKDTKQIKAIVILRGEINSDINLKSLEAILRIYSGDTVKIIDIKEGSIKLFVKGSQEDIDRLVSLIKSGELKEVSGFPVEDVQILSESSEDDESNEINNKWHLVKKIAIQAFRHLLSKSSEDDESNELNNKWHLVREIVTQEIRDRNLRGVDLSDADLSDADLIDADLSGADLSGADLCGADLSGAYLIRADLSGADLSGADLIDANLNSANLSGSDLSGANLRSADLRSADLSGANLSKTKVEKARFSSHSGISESMKQDLIKQGAIFEDSPGDRSEVLTKV
ncbi:pentapeptide repeat-containing protein [Microcoleus sp. D2B6]|uniref:pentapeptide repeat-containing protein n=1 Tax=Microcoleus sp. D2B6 TaxID=3055331 RepID=UPI002FD55C59